MIKVKSGYIRRDGVRIYLTIADGWVSMPSGFAFEDSSWDRRGSDEEFGPSRVRKTVSGSAHCLATYEVDILMSTHQNVFGEWVAKCEACGFEWMSARNNISITGDIRGESDGSCPSCDGAGNIIGTND